MGSRLQGLSLEFRVYGHVLGLRNPSMQDSLPGSSASLKAYFVCSCILSVRVSGCFSRERPGLHLLILCCMHPALSLSLYLFHTYDDKPSTHNKHSHHRKIWTMNRYSKGNIASASYQRTVTYTSTCTLHVPMQAMSS